MNIQQSRDHITQTAKCVIDESTFLVLDDDQENCAWIARVTTAPQPELGEPVSFTLLATGALYRIIEAEWVPLLAHWFSNQLERGR